MNETDVSRLIKALGLQRKPVGVKFVPFQAEYEQVDVAELKHKSSVCGMIKEAGYGRNFKVSQKHFSCDYGRGALGIGSKLHPSIVAGESYARCGLYASYPVAQSVMKSLQYCTHSMYGAIFGPLEMMKKVDIVVIIGTAEQGMRIIQGYGYKFGAPKHLCTVGNQAACSDLISKVLYNHDINLSLLCRGARRQAACEPGEIGIGFPIGMFSDITTGVAMTINPVENNNAKEEILSRLDNANELGFPIEMDVNYSIELGKYSRYVSEIDE